MIEIKEMKDEKRVNGEESDNKIGRVKKFFNYTIYIRFFILMYLYIPTNFQLKYKTKNTMVEVKIFNPS